MKHLLANKTVKDLSRRGNKLYPLLCIDIQEMKGVCLLKLFERIINSLTLRTAQISQVVLAFAMLIIVTDVIIRIWWKPLPGTVELIEMSGAVMLSMAVAYTAVKKGHIMVGVLVERFPKKIQAIIDFLINAVSLFFLALLSVETLEFASKMIEKNYVTGHLEIPISPSIYLVGFGFAMLSLVLLMDMVKAAIIVLKGGKNS